MVWQTNPHICGIKCLFLPVLLFLVDGLLLSIACIDLMFPYREGNTDARNKVLRVPYDVYFEVGKGENLCEFFVWSQEIEIVFVYSL